MKKILIALVLAVGLSGNVTASVYRVLQHPVEENSPVIIEFQYIDSHSYEDIQSIGMVIRGTLEVLVAGDYLHHISGKAKIDFWSSDWGGFQIRVDEKFALPPLQYKCHEWYGDESKDKCRIQVPVIFYGSDPDLLNYAPIRVFDIDFDGEDEIIIGTIGGNRGWYMYQIYEIEETENTRTAIPTISFRADAVIDKTSQTLTSNLSSSACGLIKTTYKSNGSGFKMVKRVEIDQFNWPENMDCIKKTYEGSSEEDLKFVKTEVIN